MTLNEFFSALNNGARWDVGVSINRSNALPLDANSVFATLAEAQSYVAGTNDKVLANAYPGQVLAVVTDEETVIYYVDAKMTLQPVGNTKEVMAYIGEIPEGSEATTIIEYINKKTEGIATDAALGELQKAVEDLDTIVNGKEAAEGTEAVIGLVEKVENLNGAQENVIEEIKVNGTKIVPVDKAVDITVPTKVSELTNDEGYVTGISGTNGVTVTRDTAEGITYTVELDGMQEAAEGSVGVVVVSTASEDGSIPVKKTLHWVNLGTEIGNKISAYDAATVQPLAEKVNALTGAFQYVGESTTNPETDGVFVEGIENFTAGNVVTYGTKEYVFDGAKWIEFGDEGSHVLKSRKVIAGEGLEGGGELSADVTIGIIDSGVTTEKIADKAITSEKLADGVIPSFAAAGPIVLSERTDNVNGSIIGLNQGKGLDVEEAKLVIKLATESGLAVDNNGLALSEATKTSLGKANSAVQPDDITDLVTPLLPTVPVYTGKEAITISDDHVIDLVTNETYLVEKVNGEKTELTLSDSVITSLGKADSAVQPGDIADLVTPLIPADYIQFVDEAELKVKDAKLSIVEIAQSKVAGLKAYTQETVPGTTNSEGTEQGPDTWTAPVQPEGDVYTTLADILKPATCVEGSDGIKRGQVGLMTPEQVDKLNALVLTDGGVEISGQINAENVIGLDNRIELLTSDKLVGIKDIHGNSWDLEGNGDTRYAIAPCATDVLPGIIALGAEFQKNGQHQLEIKEVNVNKLTQTKGEWLILNGGDAALTWSEDTTAVV